MSETPSYPALIELISRLEGKDRKTCEVALYCLNKADRRDKRLRAENAKLRSALVDAKDLLGFWSSYAPYYSKEKHGLSDDLAYIAAALKETNHE